VSFSARIGPHRVARPRRAINASPDPVAAVLTCRGVKPRERTLVPFCTPRCRAVMRRTGIGVPDARDRRAGAA